MYDDRLLNKKEIDMTEFVSVGLLLPLLGTMLGASFVFFMKHEIPTLLQKTLLGFASGVVVVAHSVDRDEHG